MIDNGPCYAFRMNSWIAGNTHEEKSVLSLMARHLNVMNDVLHKVSHDRMAFLLQHVFLELDRQQLTRECPLRTNADT